MIKILFSWVFLISISCVGMENRFYQACKGGATQDLKYIKKHIDDYSLAHLKIVLDAKKVSGKIPVYIHMTEDYLEEDARERFIVVLQKFPLSSQQTLSVLIQQQLRTIIAHRENGLYGTGELPWMKEELLFFQKKNGE